MHASGWQERLRENLAEIRGRIAAAAARSGRTADAVRLVAVTKYLTLPVVRGLLVEGVTELGESRVQQLRERAEQLGARRAGFGPQTDLPDPSRPNWHLIGSLQRNKAKYLASCTRIVHSVDSLRLADELSRQAERNEVGFDVFLQANISGEASKAGVMAADAPGLAERIIALPGLRLVGLMTLAPYSDDPEASRPVFAALRTLRDSLIEGGHAGNACEELSMGMTADYEVAVEEGATVVRIGSALYEGLPDELNLRSG